jgi:hypothetical protein
LKPDITFFLSHFIFGRYFNNIIQKILGGNRSGSKFEGLVATPDLDLMVVNLLVLITINRNVYGDHKSKREFGLIKINFKLIWETIADGGKVGWD